MKFYRAKITFYDTDWIDGSLESFVIHQGTVIAIESHEPEPKSEYWERIDLEQKKGQP